MREIEPGRVPRVLTFAVVKRIDPRLWDTWGHWWIELDGEESYGWWPTPCPMGYYRAFFGSRGVLNGIDTTSAGNSRRDAYHGEEPDHWFHPTLVVDKSDDQVRTEIRAFAHRYVGGFRWQWWWLRGPAQNCRTFQQDMFEAVGLFEEPEYLYTRGSGCPFMYPFREIKWRAIDAAAAMVARMRGWSRSHRRARIVDGRADLAEAAVSGERRPGALVGPLADPKARARARIRENLTRSEVPPGHMESANADAS